jgi:hypothetical protein
MADATEGLTAEKPGFFKPVKVDKKQLFSVLTKVLAKGALFFAKASPRDWSEILGDLSDGVVDAASTVSFDEKPQHLLWRLLHRSLISAVADLIVDRTTRDTLEDSEVLADMSRRVSTYIDADEVTIDRTFFDTPGALPLIEALKVPVASVIEATGRTSAEATAAAHSLPSYFIRALRREWRIGGDLYDLIRKDLTTPLDEAARYDDQWRDYAARLACVVDEPMFDETFGLRQVYIPLGLRKIVVRQDVSGEACTSRRLARPLRSAPSIVVEGKLDRRRRRFLEAGRHPARQSSGVEVPPRQAPRHLRRPRRNRSDGRRGSCSSGELCAQSRQVSLGEKGQREAPHQVRRRRPRNGGAVGL